jgi:hypothetical protein
MIVSLLLAAVLALASAHDARQPSPTPTPSVTATPTVAVTPIPIPTPAIATPAPSASANPTPAGSQSPETSPAPSPTPTGLNLPPLKYHIAPKQPPSPGPDSPQILEIDVYDQVIYSAKTFAARVTTNDVVTKVTISSNGHSGEMTRIAPGRFESMGNIPKLPSIIGGLNVNLVFTATTADGRSTSVKVPIKVKR